jgi:ribonuclease E
MRHDELNQGEPLPASFQMVEQPEDMDAFARKEEAKEPRQEAVVKGITPSQPAPVTAPRTPARAEVPIEAPQPHSWLSKMLQWFRTPPGPATAPAQVTAKPAAAERARESRPPRSREGRGRGDGRRDGQPHRDERQRGERRDARASDESRPAEAQGAIEAPARSQPAPRKDTERRERREPREGKGNATPRPPRENQRQEPREAAQTQAAQRKQSARAEPADVLENANVAASPAPVGEPVRPAAPGNGTEETREGGSRRRRGRRGRGGDRAERAERAPCAPRVASTDEAKAGEPAVDIDQHTEIVATDEPTPVTSSLTTVVDPSQETQSGPARSFEATETAASSSASTERVAAHEPQQTTASAPTPEVALSGHAQAAPAAPTTSQSQDEVEVPMTGLQLPPESGLVLVETRFSPPASDEQEQGQPRPRRARPPRATIPDEPLQMVETHKRDNA